MAKEDNKLEHCVVHCTKHKQIPNENEGEKKERYRKLKDENIFIIIISLHIMRIFKA